MGDGRYASSFAIAEPSQPGHVRRAAMNLAVSLGFDVEEVGRAALVVTELGSNLLKHAGGGEVLLRSLDDGDRRGLEVLALDRGPGIANVTESLRDGASTAGTAGTGLGAVRRLSSCFDIYSLMGVGTAVLAQLWVDTKPRLSAVRLDVGVVCLPKPGEQFPGDDWMAEQHGARIVIAVADGLGHGPLAAEASRTAMRLIRQQVAGGPERRVVAVHAGLKSTRGGAVAVAEVDLGRNIVRFCGLGNISAVILSDGAERRLVSQNGTAGHTAGRISEFTYPWPPGAMLVLHSDGLTTRWDLGRYPGLTGRHPSLIAAVLYRDFNRGRDDITVIAAREAAA
jgi:anti-sigma regulatory factor (Ser/Thr protein kinase)